MPDASDAIYNQSGGQTLLTVTEDGDGHAATFEVGVQVDCSGALKPRPTRPPP